MISRPKGSVAARLALHEVPIAKGPGGGLGSQAGLSGGGGSPTRCLVATPSALRSEPVFMAAGSKGAGYALTHKKKKGFYAPSSDDRVTPHEGQVPGFPATSRGCSEVSQT